MIRTRRWLSIVLCLLALLAVAAQHPYGENEGTIRGAVFLDRNRNGKMDKGEEGIGWVYFTISHGEYSHTYYSEWRTTDEAGNTYATGTFGPAPLARGEWTVTFHVPKGYIATTPTVQKVYVPGKEGGHVGYAYLGLYPVRGAGGVLPASGLRRDHTPILQTSLAVLGMGLLVSAGLGWRERQRG